MTQLTCFSFLPQLPNEWTQPRLISLPWTRRPLDINQATNSVHGGMCTEEGLREVLTGTTSVKQGGRTGYAAANLMIAKYIKYIPNTAVVITPTCVRYQYGRTYRLPINNEPFGQLTSLSFWWLQWEASLQETRLSLLLLRDGIHYVMSSTAASPLWVASPTMATVIDHRDALHHFFFCIHLLQHTCTNQYKWRAQRVFNHWQINWFCLLRIPTRNGRKSRSGGSHHEYKTQQMAFSYDGTHAAYD